MTEQTKVQNQILPSFTEAPASVNFYGVTSKGWNVQFTLRDDSEDALLARFAAFVKSLEDVYHVTPKPVGQQPQPPAQPQTQPENPLKVAAEASTNGGATHNPDWCPIHQVTMKRHEKDGNAWFSHKVGEDWCRGK